MTCCWVDAAGVPAEWVEAIPAAESQPTIVYFLTGSALDALEQSRPSAGDIAVATGARVLTVACSDRGKRSHAAAVARGIAAYAWLLGEGCDLDSTTFTCNSAGGSLMEAILVAARNRGLPAPSARVRPTSMDSAADADSQTR